MSPARIEEMAVEAPESRKRSSPLDDTPLGTKRQRTTSSHTINLPPFETKEAPERPAPRPTTDAVMKQGLRRAIALQLDKVGFGSADGLAMETFTLMAEKYFEKLSHQVQIYTNSARRSHPTPTDFELTLKYFNLTPNALNPHRKPPISRSKRIPRWLDPLDDCEDLVMPILGEELNGAADKNAKGFIPDSFPSFPSIHTYKYTPETVEAVTVSEDWGAYNPDLPTQTVSSQSQKSQTQPNRPLAPDEIPRGDPKKIREAAAKEAKYGEEALRRLMRASKIAKQKEVWQTAQQETERKERYDLWEAAMRELIEDDQKAKGNTLAPAAVHGAMGRFEIADHSMIVNSDGRYARKEMQRAAAKTHKSGQGTVGEG